MNTSRRVELFLGVGAVVYGLLLLFAVYLQPYGDSKAPEQWVTLHPGFSDTALPYIIAFGLPILGIAVGSVVDAIHPTIAARILLWLSTAILIVEAGLAILSIGFFLGPVVVLGVCASALAASTARTPRHVRA